VRLPRFANQRQFGENAQQFVPRFFVQTSGVKDHQVFEALNSRFWRHYADQFEFLVIDNLFFHGSPREKFGVRLRQVKVFMCRYQRGMAQQFLNVANIHAVSPASVAWRVIGSLN
jgi:hypothetical protein